MDTIDTIDKIDKINKICLCMIVRNESVIIERCLNSVKSIIDYLCICDTGSTDDTVEIIERWCKREKIPGRVEYEEFKNFGYNRSFVFQLAKNTYPEATYVLLMDADLTLTIPSNFSKQTLNENCYILKHRLVNGQMSYWNIRLIKLALDWKCVGVTHEYWTLESKQEIVLKKYEQLVIEDYDDGGCKADKLERDIRLIKAELDNSLDNLLDNSLDSGNRIDEVLKKRYLFYLGYTHYILQNYKEAINYFNLRLGLDSHINSEETVYCYYRIGCCYEELANLLVNSEVDLSIDLSGDLSIDLSVKKWKKIIRYEAMASYYYLMSWELRPSRAEGLYRLTRFYRMRQSYNLALVYGLIGKSIEYSEEDSIFIEDDVYLYRFDYELAQIALYIPGKEYIAQTSLNYLKSIQHLLPPNILSTLPTLPTPN